MITRFNLYPVLNARELTSEVTLVRCQEVENPDYGLEWQEVERTTVMALVTKNTKKSDRTESGLSIDGSISVRFNVSQVSRDFWGLGYDQVIWCGRTFTVSETIDSFHRGFGFIKLICIPMEQKNGYRQPDGGGIVPIDAS